MDWIGYLRRIMNQDVNETFAQGTDSLEAIRNFLTTFSGEGLCYYGLISAIPGANQFTVPELAGLGNAKFIGAFPYRVFCLWDAGGVGAAPQSEMQPVTAYVSATGDFTHNAFTAALVAGDEVLILHPRLAEIAEIVPMHLTVDQIFALVNAILTTTETGGTITTNGAEQDVYINNAPAGVYEPLVVKIDLTSMTAAESITVRVRDRIRPGGGLLVADTPIVYAGVQAVPLKYVTLQPNRYGVQVTLECTVGGPIDVDWEVIYRT